MTSTSHSIAAVLLLGAFLLYLMVRGIERHGVLPREIVNLSPWRKFGLLLIVMYATLTGATKAPPIMQSVFRMLFWSPRTRWALEQTCLDNDQSSGSIDAAREVTDQIEQIATNDVAYISFDWHADTRQPYHSRQNVLAWTCDVRPITIDGVLHEDHFLAFSSGVSTNPAVIEIEYAGLVDGQPYRELSNVVTSSYPASSIVTLQSGSHTCFWFRCKVPPFAVGARRDWSGEALFGSASAGGGFDLVGLLQVDDNGDVYVGRTGTWTIGGQNCTFTNGILIEASQ